MKNKTKYIFFGILIIIIGLMVNTKEVTATTEDKKNVNIYFFHSIDCSHCKSETKLLNDLENKYSNIEIYSYEISEHSEKLKQVQELYQIKNVGVPLTIIGDTYYMGYNEEKSSIVFIKTIEYYSKYGYKDKVGELLKVDTIPNYQTEENIPTLNEFIESYGNYKLIGNLYTNDIDLSLNTIILGILSQLNIVKVLGILLALFIISKLETRKDKLLLLTMFEGISILWTTTLIFSNPLYTLIIEILILILLALTLRKYQKQQNKQLSLVNILIIITIISIYIERSFFKNHHLIFKELINLYNQTGFNQICHYIAYIFTILIINFFIIIMAYYAIKKIKGSKIYQKN